MDYDYEIIEGEDCYESEVLEAARVANKIKEVTNGERASTVMSAMVNTMVLIMVHHSNFKLDKVINAIKIAHEACLEEAKSGSH